MRYHTYNIPSYNKINVDIFDKPLVLVLPSLKFKTMNLVNEQCSL